MNRLPKRTIEQVTLDVEKSKKVVREDIYDILVKYPTRSEARAGLIDWVDENAQMLKKIYQELTEQQLVTRLLSDIDTYNIDWEDKVVFTKHKPKFKPKSRVNQIFTELEPDPELLSQERQLVVEIDEAKKKGDYDTVRELTSELIEIQNQQPEVGAKFK